LEAAAHPKMRASAADWRQNQMSDRSRKYQPLPTIPCWFGKTPVRNVVWAEHVTAGVTVPRTRILAARD
jgi:hypothetical protein